MNLLLYLAAGSNNVGYVTPTGSCRQIHVRTLLVDIIVGIVGVFLAGQLLSPQLGIGTINDAVTIPTMLVTLAGSIFMVWIVKAVHR